MQQFSIVFFFFLSFCSAEGIPIPAQLYLNKVFINNPHPLLFVRNRFQANILEPFQIYYPTYKVPNQPSTLGAKWVFSTMTRICLNKKTQKGIKRNCVF